MKNKNLFILITAIVLSVLLVASTSALIMSGMRDEPYKVSVIIDDSASPRWVSFLAGIDQASKDYNIQVNVVSTSSNLSINQQYRIIDKEIDEGANGVIVQFTNSRGTENIIAQISGKAVLELVDTSVDADVDVEGRYAFIGADNVEMGRALANELRIEMGNDLEGKKIGLIIGNQKQYAMQEKLRGFTQNIDSSGADIIWQDATLADTVSSIKAKQEMLPADILVALDNNGLEAACEYCLWAGVNMPIFGAGNSIKNVSYLDDGLIDSMIVSNEYYMGYQSIAAVKRRLVNRLNPMENEVIGFKIINRENLFDEANQRLLFPVYN